MHRRQLSRRCMERIMTKKTQDTAKKPDATKAKKVAAKPKAQSKLGRLEEMLRRPDGATIPQLVKALAWQAHSVRGAMSGALKGKLKLKITATKAEGKDRVYRIAE
jgi:hypothetical protein